MMCFLEKLGFCTVGVVRSRLTGVKFTGRCWAVSQALQVIYDHGKRLSNSIVPTNSVHLLNA